MYRKSRGLIAICEKDAANLVKARYISGSSSVNFNLMALTTAPEDSY